MAIPIIVKLLGSLGLIIVLNRFFKSLPGAMLGGALLFALWMGFGFSALHGLPLAVCSAGTPPG